MKQIFFQKKSHHFFEITIIEKRNRPLCRMAGKKKNRYSISQNEYL